MSYDLIAKMIAQSNTALVATLAEALQGIRATFVPSLKLGRFMWYPDALSGQGWGPDSGRMAT